MARKKVKLAWITNDSTRRSTFKKRKKGLIKKAQELSTLCDVKTCVVVYHDQEAEAWPSAAEAQRILRRFRKMPETEQSKKMVDQEGFLRQRLAKAQDQLRRLERENREFDTCLLMHDAICGHRTLDRISIQEAAMLSWLMETRLRTVQDRIQHICSSALCESQNQAQDQSQQEQGLILPTVTVLPPHSEAAAGPSETSLPPAWYVNPGPGDDTVSVQPYLEAVSAWNDFLNLN